MAGELRPCSFEILLEFERISLNREIQIANGEPADNVPDRATGKIKCDSRRTGYVLHKIDALRLIRRQPDFHSVDIISHSSSSDPRQTTMKQPCPRFRRRSVPMFSTAFPQDILVKVQRA